MQQQVAAVKCEHCCLIRLPTFDQFRNFRQKSAAVKRHCDQAFNHGPAGALLAIINRWLPALSEVCGLIRSRTDFLNNTVIRRSTCGRPKRRNAH